MPYNIDSKQAVIFNRYFADIEASTSAFQKAILPLLNSDWDKNSELLIAKLQSFADQLNKVIYCECILATKDYINSCDFIAPNKYETTSYFYDALQYTSESPALKNLNQKLDQLMQDIPQKNTSWLESFENLWPKTASTLFSAFDFAKTHPLSTITGLLYAQTVLVAALFPPVIELSILDGTNGFKINGESLDDLCGISVSSAGDINGDGYDDLIIGALYADPNGNSSAGSSYVIFGNNETWTTPFELSMLDGTNGFKINGEAEDDRSGRSVSSIGDINGDGIDDLIIGATINAYVIFGKNSTWTTPFELSMLDGANGFKIHGDDPSDGCSVSNAGDINGDGIADFVIGAKINCYVVFGKADNNWITPFELSTLNGLNGFKINGEGGPVSDAGDINGDGIDDLVVWNYVIFGKNDTWITPFELSTIDGMNGFKINIADVPVSNAGDINGDGIDDLIISNYVIFGKSDNNWTTPFELSTLDGMNGFEFHVASTSVTSVSNAGDINRDGIDDLIIGDYRADPNGKLNAGSSYVIFGKNGIWTTPFELSTLNGANGFRINSVIKYDMSGVSVSGAGDINKDGLDDIIIGASYREDYFPGGPGSAYVIFGDMAPELINNQLDMNRGKILNITLENLQATTKYNYTGDFEFVISGLEHGQFRHVNNPDVSITTFYQQNIKDNQIQFVHDGSEFIPIYNVTVYSNKLAYSETQPALINWTVLNSSWIAVAKDALIYTEGDDELIIDSNLTIIDVDSTYLVNATISIIGNFDPAQDELNFFVPEEWEVEYDGDMGVLTISGEANISDYEVILRNISYYNPSINPSTGMRSIEFFVNDGVWESNHAVRNIQIISINEVPILNCTSGIVNYIENDLSTIIDSGIIISNDPDGTDLLVNAKISIIENFNPLQDVLGFIPQGGINGLYNSATGMLTLTGSASIADYQTVLRNTTYENLSNKPTTNPRTISFVVNDGFDDSVPVTRTINITAVNDAPVLIASSEDLLYAKNEAAKSIDANFILDDDSETLANATISITSNFNSTQDVLGFIDQNGIHGYYNDTKGILTLNGTASVDNYQTAIRNITYCNLSNNPMMIQKIISFIANDGQLESETAMRNISIVPGVPVLFGSGGSIDYRENGDPKIIDSRITVVDLNNFNLTSAIVSISSNFNCFHDMLSFTDQNGIMGAYNNATGVLTLNGTSSVENYQTALRSIKYENRANRPLKKFLTVAFMVNDGEYDSAIIERNINIIVSKRFPAVIDLSELNGKNGVKINGEMVDDYSGSSVNVAGDINGDGINDVIIGAFGADPNGKSRAGSSYVIFGKKEAWATPFELSALDGTNGFKINGEMVDDFSGCSVNAVGDVNDDGIDDLIIGAQYADPNGKNAAGSSYIIFGKNETWTTPFEFSALNGINGVKINKEMAYDYSGVSVSAAGDINSDGIDDLAIGACSAAPNGKTYAGSSYIIFGENRTWTTLFELSTLNGINGFKINGEEADDHSGRSVSAAGDINGDGIDDLIISADRAGPNGKDSAGSSYIIFGKKEAWITPLELSTLDGTNGFKINGEMTYDRSGISVSSAGDINDDGLDDLIIGAHEADPNGKNWAGSSYIIFGKNGAWTTPFELSTLDGTNGFKINGEMAGDYSGRSVRAAGDINGDGIGDIIIGAPNADPNEKSLAGSSYIIFGHHEEWPATIELSVLDGFNGFKINGEMADGYSGLSVSSAGDINADGIDDLIIGASRTDPNGKSSAGSSYIIFGDIAPTLINNQLEIFVGETRNITESNLKAIKQNYDGDFKFIIGGVQYGQFSYVNNPDVSITTFYQQNITDNQIQFTHDGSEFIPAYNVTVYSDKFAYIDSQPVLIIWKPSSVPTITTTSGTLTYTEGDDDLIIDPNLTIIDVDSISLANATVSIISNFDPAQDELNFFVPEEWEVEYDGDMGVLTISGEANISDYEAVLRNISYYNPSINPSSGMRSIEFFVNDGVWESNHAVRNIQIISINEVPILNCTSGIVNYIENDLSTIIDSGIIISNDPDGTDLLVNAKISIIENFNPLQDVLGFIPQGGINGLYNNATGILTLTGSASIADYQTALRNTTYENLSNKPTTNPRTISFVVNDGFDDSVPVTRTINITAINDVPVLANSGGSFGYTENDSATIVDSSITISDLDNVNLTNATITITNNFHYLEDILTFMDQNGISGIYNNATGILTLTGSSSIANYQTALRSIAYENSSDNPTADVRTVTFRVNDGVDNSNAVTLNINVIPINDAPVLSSDDGSFNYTENDPATIIGSSIMISDVDNVNLTNAAVAITSNFHYPEDILTFVDQSGITGIYNNATGILSLTGSASISYYQLALRSVRYYNPSNNPSILPRTITFTVSDGDLNSEDITRNITIVPVNNVPILTGSGGNITYTENTLAIIIDSNITITDVDNTELFGATISIIQNFNAAQDVLNFVDKNGIISFYNNASGVLNLVGVASIADYQLALRKITYENLSNNPMTLPRTVSFIANDGMGNSTAVTRDICIAHVNDLPAVIDNGGDIDYVENDPAKAIASEIIITDIDDENLMSAEVTITGNFNPTQDSLRFTDQNGITGSYNNVTGVLTLTGISSVNNYQVALRDVRYENLSDNPTTNPRTVSLKVNDGNGDSNVVTKMIQIMAVNDAPTITRNQLTITEGQTLILSSNELMATDPDNNIENLVFTLSNIQRGQFQSNVTHEETNCFMQRNITHGDIQFIHDGGQLAPTYSVSVSDGSSASATTPAEISFTAVNDIPVIENNTLTINQGQTAYVSTVDLSANDEETAREDLLFIVSNVLHGYFDNKNNSSTPITIFFQREVMNNEIRFVHDGTEIAPSYDVLVNDGALLSAISSAVINFAKGNININQSSAGFEWEDKIVGAVTGGVVGLIFLVLKIYLNYKAEQSFKKMSDEYQARPMKKQVDFYKYVLRPISKAIFDQVNIRGFFGYIDDVTMRRYLDAVVQIIDQLDVQGLDIDIEKMSVVDQTRVVSEIAKQTRKQFFPDYGCCSCSNFFHYVKGFCVSDASPDELEQKAEVIALAVQSALQHRRNVMKKVDIEMVDVKMAEAKMAKEERGVKEVDQQEGLEDVAIDDEARLEKRPLAKPQ